MTSMLGWLSQGPWLLLFHSMWPREVEFEQRNRSYKKHYLDKFKGGEMTTQSGQEHSPMAGLLPEETVYTGRLRRTIPRITPLRRLGLHSSLCLLA